MKHTPGPWMTQHGHIIYSTLGASGYKPVAMCNDHLSECVANARLIAAAPDLLEALDGMLDWALSNRGTEHEFVTCRTPARADHPALNAARTAISKAKGEA